MGIEFDLAFVRGVVIDFVFCVRAKIDLVGVGIEINLAFVCGSKMMLLVWGSIGLAISWEVKIDAIFVSGCRN